MKLCIHDPMDAIPFLNLFQDHFRSSWGSFRGLYRPEIYFLKKTMEKASVDSVSLIQTDECQGKVFLFHIIDDITDQKKVSRRSGLQRPPVGVLGAIYPPNSWWLFENPRLARRLRFIFFSSSGSSFLQSKWRQLGVVIQRICEYNFFFTFLTPTPSQYF